MEELWVEIVGKLEEFKRKSDPILKGIQISTNGDLSIHWKLFSPETMAMTLVMHEIKTCSENLIKQTTVENMVKLNGLLDKFLAMEMGEPAIMSDKEDDHEYQVEM